jgi:hypothetical protein
MTTDTVRRYDFRASTPKAAYSSSGTELKTRTEDNRSLYCA